MQTIPFEGDRWCEGFSALRQLYRTAPKNGYHSIRNQCAAHTCCHVLPSDCPRSRLSIPVLGTLSPHACQRVGLLGDTYIKPSPDVLVAGEGFEPVNILLFCTLTVLMLQALRSSHTPKSMRPIPIRRPHQTTYVIMTV